MGQKYVHDYCGTCGTPQDVDNWINTARANRISLDSITATCENGDCRATIPSRTTRALIARPGLNKPREYSPEDQAAFYKLARTGDEEALVKLSQTQLNELVYDSVGETVKLRALGKMPDPENILLAFQDLEKLSAYPIYEPIFAEAFRTMPYDALVRIVNDNNLTAGSSRLKILHETFKNREAALRREMPQPIHTEDDDLDLSLGLDPEEFESVHTAMSPNQKTDSLTKDTENPLVRISGLAFAVIGVGTLIYALLTR